ncbi:MAG: response regulator [Kiritimatiellia bacterium]
MAGVLIVDDERSIRVTLTAFLREENYDAEAVKDAGKAREQLERGEFDVVVTDVILPGVSGVDLLQRIREVSPEIPVIMMTGEPTVETAVQAVRAGAHNYLAKPVDKASILRAVANAVQVKRLRDEKNRLEAENREYRQDLESQVEKRTAELRKTVEKLKKAQEELVNRERMNALVQMASGIAHDFNNVLMPITGFTDMLLSDENILNNREETVHMLKSIRSAGEDARHIVQRLRQVYKTGDTEYGPVDVRKIVEKALSLTMPKWKEEMNAKGAVINIETEFGDVPDIKGNASDLREVFTNLVFNAVDAMPEGGTITFRARREDKRSVTVEVADTGPGMDEDLVRHCKEPFFTTKGEQGTGLGLAMVQSIATRHGGELEIESRPGSGTTIRLRFPVPAAAGEVSAAKPDEACEPLRPLKVLVIDDEDRSSRLLEQLLKTDGHSVSLSRQGEHALDLVDRNGFDMVITDRAMPLMSGDEVAAEIARRRPGAPVIMLTGFGDMMKDSGEFPEGVTEIVSKPVTVTDLRTAMRRAVAKNSGKEKE